jgi:arginine N-succinyltransferase
MILLREIQEKDLDALERLAQIPGFINLPNDKDMLREKIHRSTASLSMAIPSGTAPTGEAGGAKSEGKYIFVAEDSESRQVLGTSMIAAQHGTIESPHFYFEVGSEEKFSETINTGFIHGTLKLKYDSNGPSEIGGLVIDPAYRNNDQHLGRQISFVRFLFMGMYRNRFKRKLLAELLPPLNKKGQSPLWEAVGRRFTNMDYWEADQLCQKNKEFIFSLFPSGKIYTTFLPAEARNSIGKVGKDTEPVLHMLNKIGFTYKNQVDPFDGGPHLWANVDEILPIKKLATYRFEPNSGASVGAETLTVEKGLVAKSNQESGQYRAAAAEFRVLEKPGDSSKIGRITAKNDTEANALMKLLDISAGESVCFMPYY